MKVPPHNIAFRNCPPPRPRRVAKIVRPRPGEPLDVIVYTPQVWGMMTHWVNGRTKPCLAKDCPCQKEGSDLRSLWKGYLLAATYDKLSELVIVEISVEAAWQCKELQGQCQLLRGARLKLRRANAKANSQVIPELTLNHRTDWPAPPLDLVEALSRVWFGVKPQERKAAEQWFGNVPLSGSETAHGSEGTDTEG